MQCDLFVLDIVINCQKSEQGFVLLLVWHYNPSQMSCCLPGKWARGGQAHFCRFFRKEVNLLCSPYCPFSGLPTRQTHLSSQRKAISSLSLFFSFDTGSQDLEGCIFPSLPWWLVMADLKWSKSHVGFSSVSGKYAHGPLRGMCSQSLSCVQLFVTPWTVAYPQASLWDFPGKNTGVDCHSLLLGNLPHPGIEPASPVFPTLAGGFFTTARFFTTLPLEPRTFRCTKLGLKKAAEPEIKLSTFFGS